ncbi:hypothetical protein [Streptacidiphilus melanogenes]
MFGRGDRPLTDPIGELGPLLERPFADAHDEVRESAYSFDC